MGGAECGFQGPSERTEARGPTQAGVVVAVVGVAVALGSQGSELQFSLPVALGPQLLGT